MWIPFGKPGAVAKMAGNNQAPCLCGTVKFYPMAERVLVVADICGLPKSKTEIFALHIHEGQSCCRDFACTGQHYDEKNQQHPLHAGDLPPLFSCRGRAFLAVLTDRFCMSEVLGRTVVIHSDPDDFRSQPAGNAGEKIACGIISAC